MLNQITADQKDRTRELFELMGTYMGVQFVEDTDTQNPMGFTVVHGDPRALIPDAQPGTVAGVAGGGIAIISESVFQTGPHPYGGGWFNTAMHEVMHLLGLRPHLRHAPGDDHGQRRRPGL